MISLWVCYPSNEMMMGYPIATNLIKIDNFQLSNLMKKCVKKCTGVYGVDTTVIQVLCTSVAAVCGNQIPNLSQLSITVSFNLCLTYLYTELCFAIINKKTSCVISDWHIIQIKRTHHMKQQLKITPENILTHTDPYLKYQILPTVYFK